jgi:hypothetical protein
MSEFGRARSRTSIVRVPNAEGRLAANTAVLGMSKPADLMRSYESTLQGMPVCLARYGAGRKPEPGLISRTVPSKARGRQELSYRADDSCTAQEKVRRVNFGRHPNNRPPALLIIEIFAKVPWGHDVAMRPCSSKTER